MRFRVVGLLLLCFISCQQTQEAHQPDATTPPQEAPSAAEQSSTLVTTEVTINGTADTFIHQFFPFSNFGTQSYMRVAGSLIDGWSNALVRVDSSAILAAVPANSVIENAYLELTIDQAGPDWNESTVSIHRMTKAWNETHATWLCANTGLLGTCAFSDQWAMDWWNLLADVPIDELPTDKQEIGGSVAGTVVRFNVSDDIARFIQTPSDNLGWLIKNTEPFDYFWVNFKTRESGTATAPKLVIESHPVAGPGEDCQTDWDCDHGLVCTGNSTSSALKCRAASCSNKIRDPGESGVDCGGSCDACPAADCSVQSCKVGKDLPPVPTAVLALSTGTFSRASEASYQTAADGISGSRLNFLRYEDRGDGNGRVPLFEGARTNYVLWSREFGRADTWSAPSGVPAFPPGDAGTDAPDGFGDAALVHAVSGSVSVQQSLPSGTPNGTLSVWERATPWGLLGPSTSQLTRAVGRTSLGGAATDTVEWQVQENWRRFSKAFTPAGLSSNILYSNRQNYPTAGTASLPDLSFYSWGWQVENGAFPSSFILTKDSAKARAADVLTFATASVPAWMRNGFWQFDVYPEYASTEVGTNEFVLFSFGSSSYRISLRKVSSNAVLTLVKNGTAVLNTPLTWKRNQKLTVSLDMSHGNVTVRGADTGSGTFSVGAFTFPSSTLRVGGLVSGAQEAFARISDPRQVSSAFTACNPSANRCTSSCPCGTRDGGCHTDADCQPGLYCEAGAGPRVGLPAGYGACMPSECDGTMPSQFECGTTSSLCGLCPSCGTTPSCTGKSCGSNGCYGSCGDACDQGEAGCQSNRDCAAGLVCPPDNGWRFGKPGLRVCVPPICESPDRLSVPCGAGTACGACDVCVPVCNGNCGSDGCGGTCGTCSGTDFCMEGQCQPHDYVLLSGTALFPDAEFDRPPTAPPESDHSTAQDLGRIDGSFEIDDNGSARYSIPIATPSGRTGLQPDLSLEYNSSGSDGYLGAGWSLNGLSAITRCSKDLAHDGGADRVHFDSNDRFCMDGKRLVVLNGQYGELESEYRTENDEISKVVFTNGTIPHFVVYAKNGHVLTYGGTEDSVLRSGMSDSDPIQTWAVSHVQDRSGNFMDVKYDNFGFDSSRGFAREQYPKSISYTGFAFVLSLTPPDRSIEFEYMDRADVREGFRAGIAVQHTKLLKTIRAKVEDETVWTYDLQYDEPPDVTNTVLHSITQCSRTSKSDPSTSCKRPTTFGYGQPEVGFADATRPVTIPNSSGNYKVLDETHDEFLSPMIPADLNGNGIDDLVFQWREVNGTGTWAVLMDGKTQIDTGFRVRATNNFMDAPCSSAACLQGFIEGAGPPGYMIMDFDNDGDDEIVEYHHNIEPTKLRVIDFDRTTEKFKSIDSGVQVDQTTIVMLDANGDHLKDIIQCNPSSKAWRLRLHKPGTGFFNWQTINIPGTPPPCENAQEAVAMDLDGDGDDELLLWKGRVDGGVNHIFYRVLELHPSPGDGGTTGVDEFRTDIEQATVKKTSDELGDFSEVHPNLPFMMDVNGDGLPDMVQFETNCKEPNCQNGLLIHFNKGAPTDDAWTFDTRRFPLPNASLLGSGASNPRAMFERTRVDNVVIDIDADGRDDLIIPTFDKFLLWRSTGDGFEYSDFGMANLISWANITVNDRLWTHRMTGYDADGDGQRDLGFIDSPTSEIWNLRLRNGVSSPRLTTINPGVGGHIEVDYKHLTDPTVYLTATAQCSDTQRCIRPRGAVASEHRGFFTDLDSQPNEHMQYQYTDARMDRDGRGYLGFAGRAIKDLNHSQNDLVALTVLGFDNVTQDPTTGVYPFVGMVKASIALSAADADHQFVTQIINTLETHEATPVSVFGTITHSQQQTTAVVNGEAPSVIQHVTHDWAYDEFANVLGTVTMWDVESQGVTTGTEYHHKTDASLVDKWLINLPKIRTELVTENPSDFRETDYNLYPSGGLHSDSGLIHEVVVEPNDDTRRTNSVVDHDVYGNPIAISITGGTQPVRETEITFDDKGMFPVTITENGQSREVQYHPTFGTEIGVRQEVVFGKPKLVSLTYLDGFGRIRESVDPTGVQSTAEYFQVGTVGTLVRTQTTGRPSVQHELDPMDREIEKDVDGLDGTIRSETDYDQFGRLRLESRPFKVNSTEHDTTLEYDNMDRVVRINHADGESVTDVCYYRNVTCRKDPSGIANCVIKDNRGRISLVYDDPPDSVVSPSEPCSVVASAAYANDPAGDWVPTKYDYDPWGGLANITDPEGHATTYVNDRYGHPQFVLDPDLGLHGYTYNQFGQVDTHADAQGHEVHYKYDAFGRVRERRYVGGGPDVVTKWEYDIAGNGLLQFSESPDARTDYTYDDLGRQNVVTLHVGSDSRAVDYDYDNVGRLHAITYPDSTAGALKVEYEYTPSGILKKAFESGHSSNPYWEAVSAADDGQLAVSKYGHSTRTEGFDTMGRVQTIEVAPPSGPDVLHLRYSYYPNGSVRERENLVTSSLETFTYDELGRFQGWIVGNVPLLVFNYKKDGNIDTVSSGFGGTTQYVYDGPQAHGVARMIGGTNEEQFLYDNVGNLEDRSGTLTAALGVHWEPFNKPSRIFSASDESDAVDFSYDASMDRVRKQSPTEVTTYVGDLYYDVRDIASGERFHHYNVLADGKAVAELIRRDDGTATEDHLLFSHTDAIGSVRKATDTDGGELQRAEYTPFGGTINANVDPSTPGTHFGFTGHESDELGLVNMGGRIYDPQIGRFLSPDPFTPAAYSSQSLNRYSYALNDPLRYTDPSGFAPCDELNPFCGGTFDEPTPYDREEAAVRTVIREGRVLTAEGAFDPNLRGPRSAFSSVSDLLDTPLGTGGKVAVVTAGAAAGAALGAGVGYGTAYASTLLCGPAAGICAGVLTVGLAGYGVYSLATGGWNTLAASFSHVFSSDSATVGEALTVGTTFGTVIYGAAESGALGPAAALRTRSPILAGAEAGASARTRVIDTAQQLLSRGRASTGSTSVGAMARAKYVPSPKHGSTAYQTAKGVASRAPTNGQTTLDTALDLGNGARKVGVDPVANEIVVFDQTNNVAARFPEFHAHVREWSGLTSQMKSLLIREGYVSRSGKILLPQ